MSGYILQAVFLPVSRWAFGVLYTDCLRSVLVLLPFQGAAREWSSLPRVSLRLPWAMGLMGFQPVLRACFPARWAHCVHCGVCWGRYLCVFSRVVGASFAFCRVSGRFMFVLFCVSGFGGRFVYRLSRSVHRSALKGQKLIAQGIAQGEGGGENAALKGQKHCSAMHFCPVRRRFSLAVRAGPCGVRKKRKPERFCTFSRTFRQANFYEFLTANVTTQVGLSLNI